METTPCPAALPAVAGSREYASSSAAVRLPGERAQLAGLVAVIYRLLFKLFLQRIPAEAAHSLASGGTRALGAIPGVTAALRRLTLPRDASLQIRALGQTFPSPLGVGAGVDKDARWFEELAALGFGFVEVGTVTAVPQQGEPRPRVVRLTQERALLNKMGSPNPGAEVFAQRLSGRSGETVVGVNIGKSRVTALENADADYRASIRQLAQVSDYVVINVSSPNTPGLRDLQAVDSLRPLILSIQDELDAIAASVPVLLKISPDLSNSELDAIADLAGELHVAGIVAVNTTVNRGVLTAAADRADALAVDGGGISGPPLKARALEVLERLYARVDGDLVLVSVGGIETAEDAWERIVAGATLVQAHTGFIYGGPAWPRRVNRALARRVHAAGVHSIQDMVGAGTRLSPNDSRISGAGGRSPAGTSDGPMLGNRKNAARRPSRVG